MTQPTNPNRLAWDRVRLFWQDGNPKVEAVSDPVPGPHRYRNDDDGNPRRSYKIYGSGRARPMQKTRREASRLPEHEHSACPRESLYAWLLEDI